MHRAQNTENYLCTQRRASAVADKKVSALWEKKPFGQTGPVPVPVPRYPYWNRNWNRYQYPYWYWYPYRYGYWYIGTGTGTGTSTSTINQNFNQKILLSNRKNIFKELIDQKTK